MAPLLACPCQLEGHQPLFDAFTGHLSLGFLMNCFFFFFLASPLQWRELGATEQKEQRWKTRLSLTAAGLAGIYGQY